MAVFEIMFGKGISKSGCIVDMAVAYNIIKKSGAWFSYNDEKIGQGKENTKLTLEKNPELMAEIEAKIKEATKTNTEVELPVSEEKDIDE